MRWPPGGKAGNRYATGGVISGAVGREACVMGDKSDVSDLFALLLRVKSAWSAVCAASAEGTSIRAETEHLKFTARSLYHGIRYACSHGWTVRLYSLRGGGRVHLIRTVGPLNPDGITFQYSPEWDSPKTLNSCVMPAMQWIDTASDLNTAKLN
jgi:hypothetical protein